MPDQTRPGHLLAPTSDERIAELETLAERRLVRMQAAELDLIEARERIAELEADSLQNVRWDVWLKCNRGITESDWNEFLEEQGDSE